MLIEPSCLTYFESPRYLLAWEAKVEWDDFHPDANWLQRLIFLRDIANKVQVGAEDQHLAAFQS